MSRTSTAMVSAFAAVTVIVGCSSDYKSPMQPAPPAHQASVVTASGVITPEVARFRTLIGDPANGGQLITGTDGRNEILVPANIAARGKQLVQLPWRIPQNATSVSLQIYAVIDTENQIDEIHEDNNVGWNEIFLRNAP